MAEQKSDLSRAFSEDGALKTHVGGQALIEGIMMRGKYNWSVAVREPDGGIYVEEHDLASGRKKNGWMYWPLVRGCRAMLESLVLGYKALEIAALHAFAEEGEDEPAAAEEAGGVCSSDSPARTNSPLDCSARAELASDPSRPLGDGIESSADADADGGDDARLEPVLAGEGEEERAFSWKEDFGRPDTMIDALGAQRSLEVVSEPESSPESQSQPEPAKKSFMDEEVEFGKKEMAVSMVLGLVLGVALLQALTGHVRMALAFAGGYAVLWAVLNLVFPHVGGVAATMFTISFTFSRKIFLCLMVGSLLVAECSVHRLTAALERLRVPQVVLIPLTVTMRYFPALKDEMAHIRDAMRLRDIPASERLECFVVPLIMSATTTADELSRAATCRGIENPVRSTDTERLRMHAADWAVLAASAAAVVVVALWGGAY